MKKRIMTLFLAIMLLFQTEVETLYALEPSEMQQPGTELEDRTGTDDNGQNETPSEEEASGELSARAGEESPAEYILTFQFNGGMVEGSADTSCQITVSEGEEAASIAARVPRPVKKGYKLENWMDEGGVHR